MNLYSFLYLYFHLDEFSKQTTNILMFWFNQNTLSGFNYIYFCFVIIFINYLKHKHNFGKKYNFGEKYNFVIWKIHIYDLIWNFFFCNFNKKENILAANAVFFLIFGTKTRFYVFGGKTRFCVLAANAFLFFFWRETRFPFLAGNMFSVFSRKMRFPVFGSETRFLFFTGKCVFAFFVGKCVLRPGREMCFKWKIRFCCFGRKYVFTILAEKTFLRFWRKNEFWLW